jgi:CheY-like chemotaxis protein
LSGARILVVEDDRDTRDLLLLVLERAGVSMQSFTALLSDVAMPGEDGCALITRVRGLSASDVAALPAIALTGYARVEDRDRMLAAGFQECLAKPIDPPELVASMVALIHYATAATVAPTDRHPPRSRDPAA